MKLHHLELTSTIQAVSHPGLLCYTQPHLPLAPTTAAFSQISGQACGQERLQQEECDPVTVSAQ